MSEFWPGVRGTGYSKLPALTVLLHETLTRRSSNFTRLVEQIVRLGLGYCQRKGRPLTREDIGALNQALHKLGFKVPKLHDAAFLGALPRSEPKPSPSPPPDPAPTATPTVKQPDLRPQLNDLKRDFVQLAGLEDRQRAGGNSSPS